MTKDLSRLYFPALAFEKMSTSFKRTMREKLDTALHVRPGDTATAQVVLDTMWSQNKGWCEKHLVWHDYDPLANAYREFSQCPTPPRAVSDLKGGQGQGQGEGTEAEAEGEASSISKRLAAHGATQEQCDAAEANGELPTDMEQPGKDEGSAAKGKGDTSDCCPAQHEKYRCTLKKGHDGDHIAHWSDGSKAKRWTGDDQAKGAEEECAAQHNGYGCTKPKGHSGDHVAHDGTKNPDGTTHECDRWPQEGKVPMQKRWKKKFLNLCPDCRIETLNTQLLPAPEPKDDTDKLDFTQTPCGCEKLKEMGIA